MKRHQSLHKLSRDHHHALVQARNLNLAAERNDEADLQQAALEFAAFWERELKSHFSLEELHVLPLLAKHKSTGAEEYRQTLDQHHEIRDLIDRLIERMAKAPGVDPQLIQALGDSLRNHIRYEENTLFPSLEAVAGEDELRQLSEEIDEENSARSACPAPAKRTTTD